MRTKALVIGGLMLAFILGTVASTISTTAFNKPADAASLVSAPLNAPAAQSAPRFAVSPAATPRRVARPAALVESPAPAIRETATVKKQRSLQKEVLIVGGGAGAGAAIGAVAGGKKGAAVGALSGGVAGLIYDMATRNK